MSYPQKLPNDLYARVECLSSTLFADALKGTTGMDHRIKPVSLSKKMVGTAVTVNMKPGDNLFLHQAIYNTGKGYVIVADGKGHMNNAYLGELMALAAKANQVSGLVIDGCVRDKGTLSQLDISIFAKGFVSNGPYKEGPGSLNETITCGGVIVEPGDLIIGDEDGVVCIPKNKIEEALDKAESKLRYEKQRLQVIQEYEDKIDKREIPTISLEPSWLKEKINQ